MSQQPAQKNAGGGSIPTVTAVPVEQSPVPSAPVAVQATNAQPHVMVIVDNPNIQDFVQEDEHTGICRKCRRPFQRPVGVHDGQAQYYRCEDCNKTRLLDIIEGSCNLS